MQDVEELACVFTAEEYPDIHRRLISVSRDTFVIPLGSGHFVRATNRLSGGALYNEFGPVTPDNILWEFHSEPLHEDELLSAMASYPFPGFMTLYIDDLVVLRPKILSHFNTDLLHTSVDLSKVDSHNYHPLFCGVVQKEILQRQLCAH